MSNNCSSISEELADLCQRSPEQPVLRKAVDHVIDWLGCAGIGASTEEALKLKKASDLNNVFKTVSNDPWRDFLFEASLGNIYELDDVHKQALVHPGSVVVPVSLFIARQIGANGQEILQAIVRGYEAMCRFGRAVGPSHYEKLHNTATCGALGAAAAVCSLLKLEKDAWVSAFGLAITQSAGLWQVRIEPNMGKQWHIAHASQTGVQAALYAKAGVTGPKFIFEGDKGYFHAHCPDGDVKKICQDYDEEWQILVTSFKPWPSCRHTHSAIDAAILVRNKIIDDLGLEQANKLSASLFKEVKVYAYGDAIDFCDNNCPKTTLEARFSLQHAVSLALYNGNPELSDFNLSEINKPEMSDFRDKVKVLKDEYLTSIYPDHFASKVLVELNNGNVYEAEVKDAWGDPEWPLSTHEVEDKAIKLFKASGWDKDYIDKEIAACKLLINDPQQGCVINKIQTFTSN